MDNELNNPLLSNDFLGSFDGTVDLDALAGFQSGINPEENEFTALHTNHRGYIGDDGQIYRKEIYYNKETDEFTREYTDERLYFWTPPQELGDRGLNEDEGAALAGRDKFGAAGLYTESEIKAAWDADQGMGYLKKANPNLTWEGYWDFVQKTTELFTDPEYDDRTDGNMVAGNFQDSPEYMALLEESGIKTQYVNDDGDVFNWNGTGYSKDFKVDDSIDIGVINSMALGLIGSFVAGPILAQALTPALGAAGAKAASSAILSLAKDAMTTGELDFGAALISAATAYGGEKLGDIVGGVADDAVSQVENNELIKKIQEYAEAGYSQETIDKMYEVVQGGLEAGADTADIIEVIGDVVNGGVVEVVWDVIDPTNKEGEFDPDAPENPYDPGLIDPQLPRLPTDESGGGGGAKDSSADADNDGVPASQDPDDNNPNVPNAGGSVVNSTGKEVTTDGDKVDGDGAAVGAEHNWKYLGDGCFIKIDENGAEIPNTKVCDPDYTTKDYGAYQVGGVYSAGDDPFGTAGGDEGETVDPDNPEANYPDAGTDLGYECLPNGDKVVYTADGKGGATTEVVKGGCLEGQNGGFAGSTILGDGGDGGDGGDSDGDGTGDSIGEAQTTPTSSIDELCSGDRPEEYGFGQINYDKYCGDADGSGDGNGSGDGSGDGTGTGDGSGDGDGDGDGDGEGEGEGEELAAQGLFAGGYQGSRPVGFDYVLPQISPIFQSFQGDWTTALKELEDRVNPMRSPIRGMFDEVI